GRLDTRADAIASGSHWCHGQSDFHVEQRRDEDRRFAVDAQPGQGRLRGRGRGDVTATTGWLSLTPPNPWGSDTELMRDSRVGETWFYAGRSCGHRLQS